MPLSGNAASLRGRHCLLLFFCFLGFSLIYNSPVFSSSRAVSKFYPLRRQCQNEIEKSRTGIHLSRGRVRALSIKCARFQKSYPASTFAPRVLYLSGRMWEELYYTSQRFKDLNQALKFYGKVATLYTFSSLSDDAIFRRGILYLKIGLKRLALSEFRKLKKRYPGSDLRKLTNLHIKLLLHVQTPVKNSRGGVVSRGFVIGRITIIHGLSWTFPQKPLTEQKY